MACARSDGLILLLALVPAITAIKVAPVSDAIHMTGGGSRVNDAVAEWAGRVLVASAGAGRAPSEIEHVPVVGGDGGIDRMSTAMSCVISLTIQYTIVYTALAVVRLFADAQSWNYGNYKLAEILGQAAMSVNYAPMLACLLLACRMRVNWMTQGKGNPSTSMQICMLFCTYAVLVMTLISLVVPVYTGSLVTVASETGDARKEHSQGNLVAAIGLTLLKYLAMVGLYVGVVYIIHGLIYYEPPKGSLPSDKVPPPSPAVACTLTLTIAYFIVYAFIHLGQSFISFFPAFSNSKITGAMQGATCTMAFAPMLAILFIAARMRALMIDPSGRSGPQPWAQNCFYACTFALIYQCVLAVAVPLLTGGRVRDADRNFGDAEYEVNNKACGAILGAGRWMAMVSIYFGAAGVVCSVLTIQHPQGPEHTPPISVTMQCVINLTVQFFIGYIVIWMLASVKEATGWEWHRLSNGMESAKGTMALCPMLAILFVGTRMRALRITNNRGSPQVWVQDGMFLATWAIPVQFAMVCLLPVASWIIDGEKRHANGKTGASGILDPRKTNGMAMLVVAQIVRCLGFAFVYGGLVTVIIGAITMTPETANIPGTPSQGRTNVVKDWFSSD